MLDKTVSHINGLMRGIGSQSCGSDTAERFKQYYTAVKHILETI
jgi:hypothetical protein